MRNWSSLSLSLLALSALHCSSKEAPSSGKSAAATASATATASASSAAKPTTTAASSSAAGSSSAPGHVASAPIAARASAGSALDVDGDGDGDGIAMDVNKDGKVDGIDTDGDGKLDGQDFNGDGHITVWATLGTGLKLSTKEQKARMFEQPDPDFYDDLDKSFKGKNSTGGEVQIQPAVDVSAGFQARNQGDQSSCSAFAIAAGITLVRGQREGADPNGIFASPAFIYERLRTLESPPVECNQGTFIATGLAGLVREGAATAEEIPYQSEEDGSVCSVNSEAKEGHLYRLGGYEEMLPVTRSRIKETLSAGLPVVIGVTLPPGFEDWNGEAAKAVFKGQGECTSSVHCGGHAMLITGYDDAKSAYRILNSWGPDWGDAGYFYWDYEDFESRGPEAFVMIAEPNPKPFAAPDAAHFKFTEEGGVLYKDEAAYQYTLRVAASEPVHIKKVSLTPKDGEPLEDAEVDVWLSYGDVVFYAGENQPPAGDAQATIEGELRDGTPVKDTLTVKLEAPETSSD
ncbi:MAG: C1 family peptidase [Polyangiaceae bacterium]